MATRGTNHGSIREADAKYREEAAARVASRRGSSMLLSASSLHINSYLRKAVVHWVTTLHEEQGPRGLSKQSSSLNSVILQFGKLTKGLTKLSLIYEGLPSTGAEVNITWAQLGTPEVCTLLSINPASAILADLISSSVEDKHQQALDFVQLVTLYVSLQALEEDSLAGAPAEIK